MSFCPPDIDECQQTPNPCAYQCRNVPGSFRCLCPPGTVLLGDGRSCAGLERGRTFGNGTRVRARLRPQLVSSLGRPILSRSQGASRITRQSCPIGYTSRDGACVGRSARLLDAFSCPASKKKLQLGSLCCSAHRRGRVSAQEALPARVPEHSGQLPLSVSSWLPARSKWQTLQRCSFDGRATSEAALALHVVAHLPLLIADIDECAEQGVQCGHNQMCFNTRGGYQCMDTPCPASYQRGGSPG